MQAVFPKFPTYFYLLSHWQELCHLAISRKYGLLSEAMKGKEHYRQMMDKATSNFYLSFCMDISETW